MSFGWIESLMIGAMTGLAEILPVSAQAHNRIFEKFIGKGSIPALMLLFAHLGVLAALYICCQIHILKMVRAKKMSRIPKRKRKRPLDTRSMMDYSLWMTMLLPVVLSLLIFRFLEGLASNAIIMATFLFLNGLLLYIPQFLPSSNKDCRSLSRVEGLLMGLGGAFFAIPGFSGTGLGLSVASVTGVDRKYGLNMILLMDMGILTGKVIYDILDIISVGITGFGLTTVLCCVLAAVSAFLGAYFAIRMMRNLAEDKGYGFFAYYSWGMAFFTVILTLMA